MNHEHAGGPSGDQMPEGEIKDSQIFSSAGHMKTSPSSASAKK